MKYFSVCLTVLVFALSIQAQTPTDKRLMGLEAEVNKILKDYKAPGVSIAVVEKNKVVYTGGFGYRDAEKKLPVTENTLFAIGSCTKAFTSAMLGALAEDGMLDLDKPVRNYLPELKFYNEHLNAHVTIRDMMCHRTGLPRHDFSWYGSTASRMELLKRIEYQEPTAELREKYQYNNFMFLSQGVLLEKLTGKSWETNIRERIFTPLGMDNTVTKVADWEKSNDRSLAYNLVNDSIAKVIPYRNIDAVGPAGSINSSAKDMAKWLITWINGGKYNGKQIVPAKFRNEAMTIQMSNGGLPSMESPDVHNFGYGLAWGVSSYRGHYRVEHGGGIDGFITTTGFFPTDSIGIFVCSATGNVSSAIRNLIADKMLGLSYKDWHKQLRDAFVKARFAALMAPKQNEDPTKIKDTKPSLSLQEYAGKYSNKGYGTLEVKYNGSNLIADYNSTQLNLKHKHFDLFVGYPQEDAENGTDLFFQLNKMGKVEKVLIPLQPGLKDIEFTRDNEVKLSASDLEKYAGEFLLGPQNVSFVIRNGVLYGLLPPQPDYELVPVGNDEFKLKILEGYSVKFKLPVNGKYTEASFIQPNGVFTAKRK
jgi:CubicO group peptidase (beta-lactamase class C family)